MFMCLSFWPTWYDSTRAMFNSIDDLPCFTKKKLVIDAMYCDLVSLGIWCLSLN